MLKSASIAIALFFLTALASAQIPTSGNIFLGYSFENTGSSALDNITRANLQGWEGSLEGKIAPFFGIVADFSGHYGTQNFAEITPDGPLTVGLTGHEYEVLFGPRISVPIGKFTPFGEAMVGLAHIGTGGSIAASLSNTSFATAIGGGIDYKIFRPVALRAEVDWLHTKFFSTGQNNLRLSTGIVFRF